MLNSCVSTPVSGASFIVSPRARVIVWSVPPSPVVASTVVNQAYLLNSHHNLHGIQAVQAQVVRKVRVLCDLPAEENNMLESNRPDSKWERVVEIISVETHIARIVDLWQAKLAPALGSNWQESGKGGHHRHNSLLE